jgi:hypothetical protein
MFEGNFTPIARVPHNPFFAWSPQIQLGGYPKALGWELR